MLTGNVLGAKVHVLCMHWILIRLLSSSSSSSSPAAVDYLAKNVSLSGQRRVKLADHSAVLGLLQVETGQAYWPSALETAHYLVTSTSHNSRHRPHKPTQQACVYVCEWVCDTRLIFSFFSYFVLFFQKWRVECCSFKHSLQPQDQTKPQWGSHCALKTLLFLQIMLSVTSRYYLSSNLGQEVMSSSIHVRMTHPCVQNQDNQHFQLCSSSFSSSASSSLYWTMASLVSESYSSPNMSFWPDSHLVVLLT